jgi:hypothetical protein
MRHAAALAAPWPLILLAPLCSRPARLPALRLCPLCPTLPALLHTGRSARAASPCPSARAAPPTQPVPCCFARAAPPSPSCSPQPVPRRSATPVPYRAARAELLRHDEGQNRRVGTNRKRNRQQKRREKGGDAGERRRGVSGKKIRLRGRGMREVER